MRQRRMVKIVGASGQISIGRQYAGSTVLVEELEAGVWLLRIARVIPENELWLHKEPAKTKIDKAIAWAGEHPPEETDLEALSAKS